VDEVADEMSRDQNAIPAWSFSYFCKPLSHHSLAIRHNAHREVVCEKYQLSVRVNTSEFAQQRDILFP